MQWCFNHSASKPNYKVQHRWKRCRFLPFQFSLHGLKGGERWGCFHFGHFSSFNFIKVKYLIHSNYLTFATRPKLFIEFTCTTYLASILPESTDCMDALKLRFRTKDKFEGHLEKIIYCN